MAVKSKTNMTVTERFPSTPAESGSHDFLTPGGPIPKWELYEERVVRDESSPYGWRPTGFRDPEGKYFELNNGDELVHILTYDGLGRETFIRNGYDLTPIESWKIGGHDPAARVPETETSNLFVRNLEHLNSKGELGKLFAGLYQAAVEEEPSIARAIVHGSGSGTFPTLAFTGGFVYHNGETASGREEVAVNTDDGIGHYEMLLAKRSRSARKSAELVGIPLDKFDAKMLASFIFLHELGHVIDHQKNAPDMVSKIARRERDMQGLPVAGHNPVSLKKMLETKEGQSWFYGNVRAVKEHTGASSMAELIAIQEDAYRMIETERLPDLFAARVMKKLGMDK